MSFLKNLVYVFKHHPLGMAHAVIVISPSIHKAHKGIVPHKY